MALRRELNRLPNVSQDRTAILRIRQKDLAALEKHIFQRYPSREWGTFFQFGYRRTSWGIALSYVAPILPGPDDLDRAQALTRFRDQYSRRAFQVAAASPLAVGVVHSHPQGYLTLPSVLDDDMDTYFGRELSAYSKGAPYCSLILQRNKGGELTFTARIYDRGEWLPVETLISVGACIDRWTSEASDLAPSSVQAIDQRARARVPSVLGGKSLIRLAAKTVGIIGCSGNGTPAAHVLVRGGVGGFVLVDPKRFQDSNLERLHGSTWQNVQTETPPYKVKLLQDLIESISPGARVTSLAGNILQENVVDELLRCDVLIGGTDTHHSRAALSDLSQHYLLPSLDAGILMEGRDGVVNTQLIEFNQWTPEEPCAFCAGRIDGLQMSYEFMTDEEKDARQNLAKEAVGRGGKADAYWQGERQLHTVGYLSSTAGSLAAGYVEGWLTGTFNCPHPSFQFDIAQPRLGVVVQPRKRSATCTCSQHVGWGDQARAYRNVAIPSHWPRRAVLLARTGG